LLFKYLWIDLAIWVQSSKQPKIIILRIMTTPSHPQFPTLSSNISTLIWGTWQSAWEIWIKAFFGLIKTCSRAGSKIIVYKLVAFKGRNCIPERIGEAIWLGYFHQSRIWSTWSCWGYSGWLDYVIFRCGSKWQTNLILKW